LGGKEVVGTRTLLQNISLFSSIEFSHNLFKILTISFYRVRIEKTVYNCYYSFFVLENEVEPPRLSGNRKDEKNFLFLLK